MSSDWDLWDLSSRVILDNVGQDREVLKPTKIWEIVEDFEFSPTQRSELLRYARLTHYSSYILAKV
jgi:hypothetical protein